ncbi:MAG: class I SAM-dependent methyltransferase [Woeseiaceae bacterium]
MKLTDTARAWLEPSLRLGGHSLDGTAGNGHDTLFLAAHVQPGYRVLSFDVQDAAIKQTQSRLITADLSDRVHLIHDSHAHLIQHLPSPKQLAAAMFNLGYLPGSDKTITTQASDSVIAIRIALEHLVVGGAITVMAYRGHDGGQTEADAIAELFESLDSTVFGVETKTAPANGPVLWFAKKA